LIAKRIFDFLTSLVGFILLSPLFLLVALWVRLDSPGPVFFRQERVGLHGRTFRIHKFRTMRTDAERRGLQITVGSDSRITRAGAFLRKYKLDELPQLLDVLAGEMSLVGPRPEVPRYVAHYPGDVRERILSVRPGITDWASIKFRNENELLSNASDAERTYIEQILPIKQRMHLEYVATRSFGGDLRILLQTLGAVSRAE